MQFYYGSPLGFQPMPNGLENRTPRSVRQQQAYRATQVGSVAGVAFVLTTILAIFGAIGAGLPIVTLLITAICALRFAQVTGYRRKR
jgi:hypothetical protein